MNCVTHETRFRKPLYNLRLAIAGFALIVGSPAEGQETLVTFHRLPDLAGGEVWTVVRAVSADGSTVVGESWDAANIQPVRWTLASGLQTLGSLPGGPGGGGAFGVSADGSVIVGQAGSSLPNGEAFRWTTAAGMTGLGAPAGSDGATAMAVSQDGAVLAGSFTISFNPHAFSWTSTAGFTRINDMGGQDATSTALAMSGDGATWGGFSATPSTLPVTQATLWSGGAAAVLGALIAGGNSEVRGLSMDGSVAVGWSQSASGLEAFRWTSSGGMTTLGVLPNGIPFSFAHAVSADGEVVVGRAEGEFNTQAFMWTAGTGMVAISEILAAEGVDLAGWILTEATGVSADGLVIVGNGEDADGNRVAWVADLRDPNEVPDDTGGEEPGEGEGGDDEEPPPPSKPEKCKPGKHGKHRHGWHWRCDPPRPPRHAWCAKWDHWKREFASFPNRRRRPAPQPVRRGGGRRRC